MLLVPKAGLTLDGAEEVTRFGKSRSFHGSHSIRPMEMALRTCQSRQSRLAENANAMLIKSSNMSVVVDGSSETSVNLFLTGLAHSGPKELER